MGKTVGKLIKAARTGADMTQEQLAAMPQELRHQIMEQFGIAPAEEEAQAEAQEEVQITFHREAPKVGRNDLCPCGSGKKYKKCCGKDQ